MLLDKNNPCRSTGIIVYFRICGHRLRSHQDVRLGVLRDRKEILPDRLVEEYFYYFLIL